MIHRIKLLTTAAAMSALLALSASPALADPGKAEQARIAIAAARARIDAGNRVGANGHAPEMQVRARAALADAETALSQGHKDEAIADAKHASEFADLAISTADHRKSEQAQGAQMNAEASANAAQQAAAEANARADNAQQTAAAATAQADALRNAPPPPAPTTTTVATVEKVVAPATTVRHTTRKVVKKSAAVPAVEKTTVTTTTQGN